MYVSVCRQSLVTIIGFEIRYFEQEMEEGDREEKEENRYAAIATQFVDVNARFIYVKLYSDE